MTHDVCGAKKRDGSGDTCQLPSGWGTDKDGGKCKYHGGASPGAPEGNDWAAKHGAWAESFMSDFLTEKEQARVEDAMEVMDTPEGAQAQAKVAATIALEQFRRTGDGRFLRRYESICDTFGIAPADEMDLTVDGDVDVSGDVTAEFVTYQKDDGDE